MITNVTGFHHPDAQRIQPRWRGERYDRHEAVQALFRMPVRTPKPGRPDAVNPDVAGASEGVHG